MDLDCKLVSVLSKYTQVYVRHWAYYCHFFLRFLETCNGENIQRNQFIKAEVTDLPYSVYCLKLESSEL